MDVSSTPILVVPAVPYDGRIRFFHHETQIDINPSMADEVWKVLSYCNGYTSISSIVESSGLPMEEVEMILAELNEMEIVIDSKKIFMHFHCIGNYPSRDCFNPAQNEVETHVKRKIPLTENNEVIKYYFGDDPSDSFLSTSEQCFQFCFSEQKMTAGQIGGICHSVNVTQMKKFTTMDSELLCAIKLYVLIEASQEGIESGYYEYDIKCNCLILLNRNVDIVQLKYCFDQEEMPFGSSVQIVVAADLENQSPRQTYHDYRSTLIKTGCVSERIILYCNEQGLGACRISDFLDEPLRAELELSGGVCPIVVIPVGYLTNLKAKSLDKIRFIQEHVGEGYPVKNAWVEVFKTGGSFFGATALFNGNGCTQYTGATSSSCIDATFKATIEGYERFQSGQMRVDFRGPATQVPGKWLDPRLYFPLTEEQAERRGLKYFTNDLTVNWTLGVDHNGSPIYIPSDLVYYGQKDDENRIYYGNSSGVAAHFNFSEAKKRAAVELIERDALMKNWFSHRPPYSLKDDCLPIHIRKRAAYWAKQKRQLIVLQLPSDYGTVFETVIVSDEYPCFVSGAAATISREIDDTILKSAQEAEYNLLLALRYPNKRPIDPTRVFTPAEHGRVYHFKENSTKLSWLWNDAVPIKHIQESMIVDDYNRFYGDCLKLVTVDLSAVGSDIKVARVFSPLLVPISFGFGSSHYTHPVVQRLIELDPDCLKMPHYFA